MALALKTFPFTVEQQKRINRCHMYLRATTLSDITNASGTHIVEDIYYCHHLGRLPTTQSWPYQPRPGIKHRKTWQEYLNNICDPLTLILKTQLCQWLINPFSPRWQAYYDYQLHLVVIYTGKAWHHYSPTFKLRTKWYISKYDTIIDKTHPQNLEDIVPIDIIQDTETFYIVSIPHHPNTPPQKPLLILTWEHYQAKLHPWERRMIHDAPNINTLWQHFHPDGQEWVIVSDGSYASNTGGYSWVIHSDGKNLHNGKGTVSGNPITAFRSELYGLVGALCCITHIILYFDISSSIIIRYYSDNTKVLKYYS